MQSTLRHRLTTQLELLMMCGQLQKTRLNEIDALRYLSNAIAYLDSAENPMLGRTQRLERAHDAMYSLCMGAVYLQELLPLDQDGNRSLILQVAFELLELTVLDLHCVLNAEFRREQVQFNPEAVVFENEITEMIELTHKALDQAKKSYPDWFD
jgi:hypothetical protein